VLNNIARARGTQELYRAIQGVLVAVDNKEIAYTSLAVQKM
jgi:hypothetical protein